MARTPKITIIERKLGKEKAVGLAHKEDGLIEIDPRQSARDYFETAIHEIMHVQFPHLTEKQIIQKSKQMMNELWKIGFRRIYQ